MEHLFKLKKDGKTVGYMRLKESPRGLEWRYFDKDDNRESLVSHSIFDAAHPFVTQDKNGKDVFAGDKVDAWIGAYHHPGKVVWIENKYGLIGAYATEDKNGFLALSETPEIELIEEEQ